MYLEYFRPHRQIIKNLPYNTCQREYIIFTLLDLNKYSFPSDWKASVGKDNKCLWYTMFVWMNWKYVCEGIVIFVYFDIVCFYWFTELRVTIYANIAGVYIWDQKW